MNDPLQPNDIKHACSTYGIEIASEVTHDQEGNVWKFKGVNYKEADSVARNYMAFREEGYPGIRIRQTRQRSN